LKLYSRSEQILQPLFCTANLEIAFISILFYPVSPVYPHQVRSIISHEIMPHPPFNVKVSGLFSTFLHQHSTHVAFLLSYFYILFFSF